jgi:hypothetical protein
MRNLLLPIAAIVLAGTVQAQMGPAPVRGTLTEIATGSITITKADSTTVKLALMQPWTVSVMKPIGIEAIQSGSFIGTAEMPQADGTGRSLEVHVFPPGVKAGEGHYAWDLQEGSMMTNGTVGEVTETPDGRTITVTYPDGTRTLTVPADIPIVEITNGTPDQLKTGIPVFVISFPAPDGSGNLMTGGIAIGVDGAAPPM